MAFKSLAGPQASVDFITRRYKGCILCIIGGLTAYGLSALFGFPVLALAIILGLGMNFLSRIDGVSAGIDWMATDLLKIGVALLGLRISIGDIMAGGIVGPAIVAAAMFVTFAAGAMLAKYFDLSSAFARLSAGSVSICGVSAALAMASVLPKRNGADEELAIVIITVTALSTVAMILYPNIALALSFSEREAGIFIGGSIHDVAQVVGAGYSISDEAGDTAVYIKLMRVAMLLPIVLFIGAAAHSSQTDHQAKLSLIPSFLIGFAVLAVMNSFGWVAEPVSKFGQDLSGYILVTSMFAVGVRSRIRELVKVGPKPLILITLETLIIGGCVIAGLLIFRSGI